MVVEGVVDDTRELVLALVPAGQSEELLHSLCEFDRQERLEEDVVVGPEDGLEGRDEGDQDGASRGDHAVRGLHAFSSRGGDAGFRAFFLFGDLEGLIEEEADLFLGVALVGGLVRVV